MYHILFTPCYDKDDLHSHNSFDSSVIKREKAGHIANAIFVPLNSSTSSKHMFMAVSDFGAWKRNYLNLTLSVQSSPPYPGESQTLHSREGFTRQILRFLGNENS